VYSTSHAIILSFSSVPKIIFKILTKPSCFYEGEGDFRTPPT